MFKLGKIKELLAFSLIAVLLMMFFSVGAGSGQKDSLSEIQEKLAGISAEERGILQNLFTLTQEIKEMEKAEAVITLERDTIIEEIKAIRVAMEKDQIVYEEKKAMLKEVLKTYQKRGPGTYLEIILDSDNLTTLLRRINALRDLTRNTGVLLDSLETSRVKLSAEKLRLDEKLALMEEKQKASRESLDRKLQRTRELEAYMTSLNDGKGYYQAQLTNIQQMWDELKPLFSKISDEFSSVIKTDNLPSNAIKTTITFSGIKGSIGEEAFNHIMKENPRLPKMVLHFYPGRIEMSVPEKNLVLAGTFVILEGNTLKFEVKEGSFYGMPLSSGAIEELLQEGYLTLNLKPLVGSNVLKSIEILEGTLEFLVTP
jgi:peptidoglycan hydrolase CwlO-like protein